jgi:hypothetical protein
MPGLTKLFANVARAIGQQLHPREDIVASGVILSPAAGAWVAVDGAHISNITVFGAAYSVTWRLLGCRIGGGLVEQIPFRRKNDLSVFVSSRNTANETAIFEADVTGYEAVRIDPTAYGSGAMSWEIANSVSAHPSGGLIKPEPAQFSITGLGAANSINAVAIGGLGIGLTHVLRRLTVRAINNTATAAGVPATAILQITSANLPGARTWRRDNSFPAFSSVSMVDENWALGLRASTANTTTSITVPALGIGVQSEITMDYCLSR